MKRRHVSKNRFNRMKKRARTGLQRKRGAGRGRL